MNSEETLSLSLREDQQRIIFGSRDSNLRAVERTFGVRVQARGEALHISGSVEGRTTVARLISELSDILGTGYPLTERDILDALRIVYKDPQASLQDFYLASTVEPAVLKLVQPRSLNQKFFLEAIGQNDMMFAIGPAGTGKTYLSVGIACAYFLEHRVRRIVLTRPAVEAGERLGFLPGDILQKVDPYLRPLYDALHDILGYERVVKLIERSSIEIAPLAFMRGRTLNDSFIILDEAQNTTPEQMKMFLTRMGFASKVICTGDVTQIDLPPGKESGLKQSRRILEGIPGIAFMDFDERDVVRHSLVSDIIAAYERNRAQ
jgi:phosphate starvation-inducible protein PhoH and related proteins